MSACISDNDLDKYFRSGLGSLDHAHLDVCTRCLDRVTEQAQAQPGVAEGAESQAAPELWIAGQRGVYRLLQCMNFGSFGEVWLAESATAQRVAVKLLHQALATSAAVRLRFEHERRALEWLSNHPNIVGLCDFGEHEGRPFLVTEYLAGQSLQDHLTDCRREQRRPPYPWSHDIFVQLCSAVGAAHCCSAPGPLLHRDIKPANVMLSPRASGGCRVKLIDFGLVQLGARNGTHTGQRLGTPAYMAPEQALGIIDQQRPWTDVFALVALLVELLTLESFSRPGTQLWQLSLRGPRTLRRALSAGHPELPAKLWDVIERSLSEDGSRRYPDANTLAKAVYAAWPGPPP